MSEISYTRKKIKKLFYIHSRIYYVGILNDGYKYYVLSIMLICKWMI